MKVLVINDHKINGGTESVVAMLYQLLKDDITIDVMYGEEVCDKVNVFSYIYSNTNKKLVYNRVINGGYDLVHLQNYYHIYSPSILRGLTKAKKTNPKLKVIYSAHDYHLICPNSGYYYFENNKLMNFEVDEGWRSMFWKNLDKRSFAHDILKKLQWINAYVVHDYKQVIDVVTTPSYFLREVILAHYNLDVRMIRNPMSKSVIAEIAPSHVATVDHKVLKIVFFGRLSIEKGLTEFITSLKNVKIPYQFTIIGQGPNDEELKQLVKSFDLQNKIVFTGPMVRSELLRLLPQFDLFVLPSIWYENAPMSILEAAQANIMIATHKVGGMYEMVEAVGGGLYFKQGDAESLQRCLDTAMSSKIRGEKPIRDKYFNDFLPETFKQSFLNLYNEVLNDK